MSKIEIVFFIMDECINCGVCESECAIFKIIFINKSIVYKIIANEYQYNEGIRSIY